MLVLGLSGMLATPADELIPGLERNYFHDSAACLFDDGIVVSAVEQERLNRIKHSNLFPDSAAVSCVRQSGVDIHDVDRIAYFWSEEWLDVALGEYLRRPSSLWRSARELIADRISHAFGAEVEPQVIDFWPHHRTHAASTFYHSGFDESLVLVADGNGEAESLSVYHAIDGDLRLLRTHPIADSLGHYYTRATKMVGYRIFDEYKVMGLAPYGDPRRYRPHLEALTELLPDGGFHIDVSGLRTHLHEAGFVPRHRDEPFGQDHRDFAAAVQENLERTVRHVLEHWAAQTGSENLCLAGGVAHNSSMNGGILRSGLFRRVFVHPASHDSGAAMGAAMLSSAPKSCSSALRHVFLGPALEDEETVLHQWSDLVDWERSDDVCADAAHLLANGSVVGWAQGRSEFGPRALGHRSILADPRPESNKDRVNLLIKEREGFRPFAPAVLEEYTEKYFEVPDVNCALDFMGFVLRVLPERVSELGAVTHVDQTARVQVVRRETNERFWRLIEHFHQLTGVPVVLNTSFNNHAEPIVQSARDCVVAFLTTGLDALVMGDFVVRKKAFDKSVVLGLRLSLPPLVEASEVRTDTRTTFHIGHRDKFTAAKPLSEAAFRHLAGAPVPDSPDDRAQLAEELWRLWQDRLIDVTGGLR